MERVDRFLIWAARITIKVNVISAIVIGMILAIGFMGPGGIILSVLGGVYLLGLYHNHKIKVRKKGGHHDYLS